MKKIKQLSFVFFIFSVLALSYPVTQVFAQGGGQCDSNPACDPTSGTCCGQCDPSPACVAGDTNAIPCCSNNEMNRDPDDRHDRNDDMRRSDDRHDRNDDMRRSGDRHDRNDGMKEPGCDPNLPHDQPGGCPDGFQGKPHHGGSDDDGNPPGQEGDPYAKQCEQWKQKGSPSWDTHSVEHCSGGNQSGMNPPSEQGNPYAKQCEQWKQKGSPSWDTHSVEHCSGDN